MSFQATEYVLAQNIPSAPQKLVLMCIAHHVDRKTGKWTMRQDDIAQDASMSVRQVKVHIPALEAAKRIVRDIQRAEDGSPEGTEYTLVGYTDYVSGSKELAVSAFEKAASLLSDKETQSAEKGDETKVRKPALKVYRNPHVGSTETRTYKKYNPFTIPLQSVASQADAQTVPIKNTKKAKASRTATRLPEDWSLTPEEIARDCAKWSLDSRAVLFVADAFRDYWHGCGKDKTNWNAVWSGWLRKSVAEGIKLPKVLYTKTPAESADADKFKLSIAEHAIKTGYVGNGAAGYGWRTLQDIKAWLESFRMGNQQLATA